MLAVAQSMAVLVLGTIAVIILLGVLVIVHKQSRRMKELEYQVKTFENIEATHIVKGDSK